MTSVSAKRAPSISLWIGDGVPDAACGGVPREVAEVPRFASEGAPHAVRRVGVATVDDLAEQVGQQVDDLGLGTPCSASSAACCSSETGA